MTDQNQVNDCEILTNAINEAQAEVFRTMRALDNCPEWQIDQHEQYLKEWQNELTELNRIASENGC